LDIFSDIPANIEGHRINLRRLRKSDAGTIRLILKDKEYHRLVGIPHPYTLRDALAFIIRAHRGRLRGTDLIYALTEKNNDKIIGRIGLHGLKNIHNRAEIGYWLAKEYWGQGLIGDAIRMILKIGFKDIKLMRIHAYTFDYNKASIRTLEKLGFTNEGLNRKFYRLKNRYMDCYVFSILREEFKKTEHKNRFSL
jgi:RimJ/RimL family protein N-acetyltransferase